MVDPFLAHILIAFIAGGAAVGLATFTARKYYSGIGGLIGGLPTISSISFFFIGLNQSPDAAALATIAFPLGMSFTFVFLLTYATLARRGFKTAIISAFAAWFTLSGLEGYAHVRNLLISLVAVITVFSLSIYIFRTRLKLPYAEGTGAKFSGAKFLQYALPGGTVVASAVYFSQILGTTAGGIAAAFPAIFSLTLTFTYLSEGGMNLSRSMSKPLMVSAMTVALPYSVLVGWLYPTQGPYLGTVTAIGATLPLVLFSFFLVHQKRI